MTVVQRPPGLPRNGFGIVARGNDTVIGIATDLGDLNGVTVVCYVRDESDGSNPVPAGLTCSNGTTTGLVDVEFGALQAVCPADTWAWYTLQFKRTDTGLSSATTRFAGITVETQPDYSQT